MEKNLNKEKLITQVAEKTGLKRALAQKAVEGVFAAVSDCLAQGGKFQFIGFGSFGVKKRAARKGIHPRTGERIRIKSKKVPFFSPGKKLCDRVK